jgi:hypothetical protein
MSKSETPKQKGERKMTVFEKLESLGLDYYIVFGSEINIYGEGDEYEEGNDRQALDEMREWAEDNKTPHHDSSVYIDGYLIIFQEDEVYPDYL